VLEEEVSWLEGDEFAPTVARPIVVWNINRCCSGDRVDEPPVPGALPAGVWFHDIVGTCPGT
jgi:hypothetical protein